MWRSPLVGDSRQVHRLMPDHPARHKAGEVCPECGFVHIVQNGTQKGRFACVGHVRHPIRRACTNPPMTGQNVCNYHGGAARQNRAAGQRRVAKVKVVAQLARMGIPVETTPEDALLGQVAEAAGNVEFLREQVQGLDALHGPNHLGDQMAHVVVQLYGEWADRLTRFAKMAIDAGIAERQVRIAERQGALLADFVRTLLDSPELELSLTQRERGRVVAAKQLRLLSS